jgi:hypothetical protein
VFRETVLAIVRERYSDFGPTLAAEKLSELHGLDLFIATSTVSFGSIPPGQSRATG